MLQFKSHVGKVDFGDQSAVRRWKIKMGDRVQNKISAEFKSHHGGHKVHNKISAEFKSQGFVAWEDEDGITWLAPCRHRNA